MPLPHTTEHRILYPLYTVMTWKVGNGVVFPLYQVVRHALDLHPGDLLIARVHTPYLTIRRARPERIIPIEDFGPEHLPPSWPGKDDNATTPESATRTTPATPQTHEGEHRG
jgi:hypothetical protein